MKSNARDVIAVLRRSHERLSSLAGPLQPDDLRGPSYCSEWSVAQVLSHLGSQSELFGLYFDAGIAGTPPPESGVAEKVWDAWNARTPEQQAGDGLAADARLLAKYEDASDAELEHFHLSMWGMEINASKMTQMRLAEHALHTWDIEVMRNPGATLAEDAAALMFDQLSMMVGFVGKPQGKEMRLKVSTTGPAHELLLAVDGGVSLASWSNQEVEGELRLPAEALYRLVSGRLDRDHTPASVTLTADTSDLDDLRGVFPGF